MDRRDLQSGPWHVQCVPGDGARISRLRFRGVDLLTREPAGFHPPIGDHGRFETRPAYGYDDCFPSVDACAYPEGGFDVPDHGELLWLPWDVRAGDGRLVCSVASELLPVTFTREMVFGDASLEWRFGVRNASDLALPFSHVMHALMPPGEVVSLRLPACAAVVSESGRPWTRGNDPTVAAEHLLGLRPPAAEMLLLRGCRAGRAEVDLRGGLTVAVVFPVDLFPTLGVWWNVGGHPAEAGLERFECALEPMPGPWSSLARSHAEGQCLTVPPGASLAWTIAWHVRS